MSKRIYKLDKSLDESKVKKEISRLKLTIKFRFIVTTFITFLLMALTVLMLFDVSLPTILLPNYDGNMYHLITFIPLVAVMLINFTTLRNGLVGLLKLKGDSDTMAFLSTILIFINTIFLYFNKSIVSMGYVLVACFILMLNVWGKYYIIDRTIKNYKVYLLKDKKFSVKLCNKKSLNSLQMDSDISVAYKKPTTRIENFFANSFEYDVSEYYTKKLSLVAIFAIIVISILTFVFTSDLYKTLLTALMLSLSLTPFYNLLVCNISLHKVSKDFSKKGGMISSYTTVEKFCDVNNVVVKEKDLFTPNDIILNDIIVKNSLQYERILTVTAAALFKADCALYSSFDEILKGQSNILPRINNIIYIKNKGMTFYTNSGQYFFGTRDLLMDNDIKPPSIKVELEAHQNNKNVLYLSDSKRHLATFIIEYKSNRSVASYVNGLIKNNMVLYIDSKDPILNADFISRLYKVPFSKVKILSNEQSSGIEHNLNDVSIGENSELITNSNFGLFARSLIFCKRLYKTISLSIIFQILAVVSELCITIFMLCTNSIDKINLVDVMIIQLFWGFVIFVVNKFSLKK